MPAERADLRERIGALPSGAWSGVAYRHVLGETPPLRENRRGARWNPPGTGAVYASLERETCLAEVAYRVSLDVVKPRSERRLYTVQVSLARVVDLGDWAALEALGFDRGALEDDTCAATRRIGGSVASLGSDGLIVPSLRARGKNLVLFPANFGGAFELYAVRMEVLPPF